MTAPDSPRSAFTWPAIAIATVIALLAAGAVLFFASRGGDDAPRSDGTLSLTPADEVATGDPLDIEFTDLDGTTGTLRGLLDGRPVVLNFFASWCTPCRAEMPDFESVHDQVGDDVLFLGIAVTDRPEDVEEVVTDTGITYRFSRDIRGDIANAFGVTNMPTTFLLDGDGASLDAASGGIDAAELRRMITDTFGIPT